MTVTMSAQTSCNDIQYMLEGKLDFRIRKGIFGPKDGKNMIIFIDDINLPAKDGWGTQSTIEFLR